MVINGIKAMRIAPRLAEVFTNPHDRKRNETPNPRTPYRTAPNNARPRGMGSRLKKATIQKKTAAKPNLTKPTKKGSNSSKTMRKVTGDPPMMMMKVMNANNTLRPGTADVDVLLAFIVILFLVCSAKE